MSDMKKKECQGCKYLFGGITRPECDWYDEPIRNIHSCIKRRQNANKSKQSKV